MNLLASAFERIRTRFGVFHPSRKIPIRELCVNPTYAAAKEKIGANLVHVFEHLGLPAIKARQLAEQTLAQCQKDLPIASVEAELRRLCGQEGLADKIARSLRGRAETIFGQIRNHIVGDRVLDLGCGDGQVGRLIADRLGKRVWMADIVDYQASGLAEEGRQGSAPVAKQAGQEIGLTANIMSYNANQPSFRLFNGRTLPFPDKSMDSTLALTVLHHADDPLRVLRESMRVTRKRVLVIESIYLDETDRQANIFQDWFYNRVLHEGVNVPLNFQSPEGWKKTFQRHGLKIVESLDLGVDQPTVPEHHWLYVLDVPP